VYRATPNFVAFIRQLLTPNFMIPLPWSFLGAAGSFTGRKAALGSRRARQPFKCIQLINNIRPPRFMKGIVFRASRTVILVAHMGRGWQTAKLRVGLKAIWAPFPQASRRHQRPSRIQSLYRVLLRWLSCDLKAESWRNVT
jgi:hypothetical protein